MLLRKDKVEGDLVVASPLSLLLNFIELFRCEYTTGIIERGCGRETDKARGAAECLIWSRDHIRVQ